MDSPQKSTNAATTTTTHIETRSSSRIKRNPFSDLTNTTPSYLPNPKPKPVTEPASDPQPAISSAAGSNAIAGDSAFTPKSKEKVVDFRDSVDNNDKTNPKTVIKSNSKKINHIQIRSSGRLKRKLLSDLTNTNPSSLPESVPESKPVLDPEPALSSKAGREAFNVGSTSTPKSNEAFLIFYDSRLAKTRRKSKERDAEAASALSCPPGRTTSIGRTVSLQAHVKDLHKAFSVPCDKTRKRAHHKSMPTKLRKPILPPDFVEKQKAYFAEIDAFELPEEEVSDDALE